MALGGIDRLAARAGGAGRGALGGALGAAVGVFGAAAQGVRWGTAELGRRPLAWLVAGGFLAVWPMVAVLGPLGVTTRGTTLAVLAFELGCLALLGGVAFGVALLARAEWSLERAAWSRRLAVEAGVLAGVAAVSLTAALAPAVVLPRGVALGALFPGVAWTAAHAVAVGLLALRVAVRPAGRALAVPLLAWVLPALPATGVGLGGASGRALRRALDITQHGWPTPGTAVAGAPGLELVAESAHRWGALLPITALVGASCLLARRAPSAHALRHPR